MSDTLDSKESHLRSVMKAISYRVLGTLTTGLLAWFVVGNVQTALTIGALEPLVKTVLYYVHERIWQQLPRGAVRRMIGMRA